jgi:hypothetical protein
MKKSLYLVSTLFFICCGTNNTSSVATMDTAAIATSKKKKSVDAKTSFDERTKDLKLFYSTDTKVYFSDTSEAKKLKMVMYPNTKIPAGQTFIISGPSILFPLLEMEDNSKLVVAYNLTESDITIWDGKFGKNCEIIADGVLGKNSGDNPANPWATGWWQAPPKTYGVQGFKGLRGETGSPGRKLTVHIGISAVKTLLIHSNGGNGGNGGIGGNGQLGGNSDGLGTHCGDGGKGGNGGDAGSGGDANTVQAYIWLNGSLPLPDVLQYVVLGANGGTPGIPGGPGQGVRGGDNCSTGPIGNLGAAAGNGSNGKTSITPISKPFSLQQMLENSLKVKRSS